MPYKNPEDKRRWEQEHREQRNARRRQGQLGIHLPPIPALTPDSVPAKETTRGWEPLAAIAAGIAIVLLSVLGASQINSAAYGSENLGKNSDQ